MRAAQAFDRVGPQNAFLEHLGVSNVDFDPENGSRTVQLARGAIYAQIRALVQPFKRSDRCDDTPKSSS